MNPRRLATSSFFAVSGLLAACADSGAPDASLTGDQAALRATDAWERRADMSVARELYATVTLADGRVMVIGGIDDDAGAPTAATEIYDPLADRWTPAADAPMAAPFLNTAVTLSSGQVLVVGGDVLSYDGTADARRSFVYVPADDRWIETGSLPAEAIYWGNFNSNGAELPDGRVLIAGGFSFDTGTLPFTGPVPTSRVSFVYTPDHQDPARGRWDFTRDDAGAVTRMTSSHEGAPMVALRDGRVLYCGGRSVGWPAHSPAAISAACDLFDWRTNRWSATAPMPAIAGEDGPGSATPGARFQHVTHRLTDGRVLFAGGYFLTSDTPYGIGIRRSTVIFDPRHPESPWSTAPEMNLNTGRFVAQVYGEPNGNVVVAGGGDENFFDQYTTEIFDAVRMRWSYGAQLPSLRPFWADDEGLPPDVKVCVIGTFGTIGQAELRHGQGFMGPSGWSNESPAPPKNVYVYVPGRDSRSLP